jgi:hypothetical protein
MHRDSILALGLSRINAIIYPRFSGASADQDLSLLRIGFSVARLTNQDHRQAAKAPLTHICALTIIAVLNFALFGDR